MRSIFRIENIFLALGLLVSLIIGLITLHYQVTFGYDQARDAFNSLSITQGDIKILGPATDVPGVFHGVFYYYFLALPYFVFQGDPQLVATFYFALFYLTIPMCGYLAYLLFKKKNIAIISMVLYACSPLFIAFSKWLSNPGLAFFAAPGILIFLWKYLSKPQKISAGMVGLFYGLLIQSNLAFGVMLLLLPVYLLVFKVRPRLLELASFAGGLFLATLSYFLVEIKFHARGITSMMSFLAESHKSKSFVEQLSTMLNKITELFSLSFSSMAWYVAVALIILCAIGVFYKRKHVAGKPFLFVLIWICNIFIFSLFNSGIINSSFVLAPTIVAFVLICAYLITLLSPRLLIIPLVIVLVAFQVNTTLQWFFQNYTPLSIPRGINVSDAKQVIAYTYKEAGNKPFIIKTITNPLFINTTWAYLYKYEKGNHNYLPYWGGSDQTGYAGAGVLQSQPKDTFVTTEFLIIEPPQGIPDGLTQKIIQEENIFSKLISTKHIGTYTIQERKLNSK